MNLKPEKGKVKMNTRKNSELEKPQAMAFYHGDGFVPSYEDAKKFAGNEGRVATLPDIIRARLATGLDSTPWVRYFTTNSSEFVGRSKGGRLIAIVAHGVGPMADKTGIMKAYAHSYQAKNTRVEGGRITLDEFRKLEDGFYGKVYVVDLEEYLDRYEFSFLSILRYSEAECDPMVRARLGGWYKEYLDFHLEYARKWHAEESQKDPENRYGLAGHEEYCVRRRAMHREFAKPYSDPFLISIKDGPLYRFFDRIAEPGLAFANLLSIGQLQSMNHEQHRSLVTDVSCHSWNDGTRFVGVNTPERFQNIHPGPDDVEGLIEQNWESLLEPANEKPFGFYQVMEYAGRYFTHYGKKGDSMSTYTPEYLIEDITPVGEVQVFRTEIGGHYVFFRFDMKEIKRIAPPEANAFMFKGEPEIEMENGNAKYHTAPIQFYKISGSSKFRLPRPEKVRGNYELLMKLMGIS